MAFFKVIFIYFISQTLIFLPKRYVCDTEKGWKTKQRQRGKNLEEEPKEVAERQHWALRTLAACPVDTPWL